jgi:hypothetical protein
MDYTERLDSSSVVEGIIDFCSEKFSLEDFDKILWPTV